MPKREPHERVRPTRSRRLSNATPSSTQSKVALSSTKPTAHTVATQLVSQTVWTRLLTSIERLILKIESTPMTFTAWIVSFMTLAGVRLFLESFSGNQKTLFEFLAVVIHGPLFWLALLFSSVIILRVATKKSIASLMRIALIGWTVILVPPIVDLIYSRGSGNQIVLYLFNAPMDLVLRYLTFFGPGLDKGATLGIRVMVALAIAGIGLYVGITTRKPWRSLVAAWVTYTAAFLFGSLPSVLTAIRLWPLSVTTQLVQKTYLTPDAVWGKYYALVIDFFDRQMAASWLVACVVLLLGILYLWKKEAWRSWLHSWRPLRVILLIAAIAVGIWYGAIKNNVPLDFTFNGWLWMLLAVVAAVGVWLFSVAINDLADQQIDRITNTGRPLANGLFSESELKVIAASSLLVGFVAAFIIDYASWLLIAIFAVANLAYSLPPYRLRRFIGASSFISAFCIALIFLLGYNLTITGNDFRGVPYNILGLILATFTLSIPIKDLKDTEGDRRAGIQTLTTIFGAEKGLTLTAWTTAASFLVFPLFLWDAALIIPAIIASLLSWNALKRFTNKELGVFIIFALFIAWVGITHFQFLDTPFTLK